MNLKTIIKEEMDDFDWARDIKTNQDFAQDIVNKTNMWMGDDGLRVNLPFMTYHKGYSAKQLFKSSSLLKSKSPTIMFLEYMKNNYGFDRTDYIGVGDIDLNVNDIWFRYKNLITRKVLDNLKDKPINESDDFDWTKNIKPTIIKSELLFESLEDRLKSAYRKWCKKMKLKDQDILNDIENADGYVEELDLYIYDFEDPHSKMYQKAEELYAKEDYEGIHNLIADHQCRDLYTGAVFKDWISYRNLTKSSDIFQYKSERELARELSAAKEKSFTKKLKKASAGEDFDKIWENDDMLIVVPKSHIGACKFGQGTKWCTASKTNNYFDGYYEKGILYRVLQKNDNYKESFSNFQMNNKLVSDIENLSKVSINLRRKQNSMSMVDKVDYTYGNKSTLEFLNSLPSEGYKAIKNYQSLNEQNIKKIIREELIKESGVENYLQSIASITSGNQKKYYQWILDNLEQVPVVSYRSNEELKDKIDSFVKRMRRTGSFCEKKGCFDTAYNTAMYVPGVHYIEGYVQSMIPIVHAWNYLPEEGIYFDLINDIAWEEDSHFNEYYKVIDLNKSGVLKWSSKTGYGGGFLESPQFINSILQ